MTNRALLYLVCLQKLFEVKARQLRGMLAALSSAVAVGVLGALSTVVFRLAVEAAQRLVIGAFPGDMVQMASKLPYLLRVALPAIGGVLAGCCLLIARRSAATNTDYMEAVTIGDGVIPVWQSIWRSISSLLSIATGGSIGREGSMVQLAALSASITGRLWHSEPARIRRLVACGAAAGITSAYNAPIAGAFFVGELVFGSMAMELLGPILVSCVAANITMRAVGLYHPAYELAAISPVTGRDVVLFIPMAFLSGTLAPCFLGLLSKAKQTFQKLPIPLPIKLGMGGLIVGTLSIQTPQVFGNGYEVINSLLHQHWGWQALVLLLIFKLAATLATAGSGAVGGVFTPTLCVGAIIGYLFGEGAHAIWPMIPTTSACYVIVGMAAFLSATTSAPLMSSLMLMEMSTSYALILPIMVASVIGWAISRNTEHISMYDIVSTRIRTQRRTKVLAGVRMRQLLFPARTVVTSDTDIDELTRMFHQHSVKYVYVVDSRMSFRGVVALDRIASDVLMLRKDRLAIHYLNEDFSNLHPETTLEEALQIFIEHNGERLPVLDEEKRLLGVVHKSTLLDVYSRLRAPDL